MNLESKMSSKKNWWNNPYRRYLFLEAAQVLAVILLFKLITEVKIAAFIAGVLFILLSGFLIFAEVRRQRAFKSFTFYAAVVFEFASALPIFYMRLSHWDMPFDQIEFLGFKGPQWHQASNSVFMLLLAATFIDSFRFSFAKAQGK